MTDFDAVTIGLRMARIRTSRGYSQAYVAARLGIHRNHYAKYERGKKLLHLTRLNEIAAALQVEVHDLLRSPDADVPRRPREPRQCGSNIELSIPARRNP